MSRAAWKLHFSRPVQNILVVSMGILALIPDFKDNFYRGFNRNLADTVSRRERDLTNVNEYCFEAPI